MAVQPKDIIPIKVSDNWIHAGIKYGQLSWTQTFNRMGKASPYKKIQNIAIGKIAESAVLEYLNQAQIEFDLKGSTKWYEIDIDDLEINDYQIDVKSNLVDQSTGYIKRKKIGSKIEEKLEWYSRCHALVPTDQVNAKNRGNNRMKKIYLFVFVEGKINQNSTKNIMHAFWDYRWLKKAEHKNAANLGKLEISSSSKKKIELTIYGTSEPKKAVIENITINANKQYTKNSFHQVFAIYSNSGMPDSELKINSQSANLIEIIKPILQFSIDNTEKPIKVIHNDWNSIDLQIDHCFLVGWIEKDEFLINSKEYPRFTKIFEQYQDTLTANFACEVKELEPIDLIRNV